MTRLYIVEGLPCSGKSTTARFIANALNPGTADALPRAEDE